MSLFLVSMLKRANLLLFLILVLSTISLEAKQLEFAKWVHPNCAVFVEAGAAGQVADQFRLLESKLLASPDTIRYRNNEADYRRYLGLDPAVLSRRIVGDSSADFSTLIPGRAFYGLVKIDGKFASLFAFEVENEDVWLKALVRGQAVESFAGPNGEDATRLVETNLHFCFHDGMLIGAYSSAHFIDLLTRIENDGTGKSLAERRVFKRAMGPLKGDGDLFAFVNTSLFHEFSRVVLQRAEPMGQGEAPAIGAKVKIDVSDGVEVPLLVNVNRALISPLPESWKSLNDIRPLQVVEFDFDSSFRPNWLFLVNSETMIRVLSKGDYHNKVDSLVFRPSADRLIGPLLKSLSAFTTSSGSKTLFFGGSIGDGQEASVIGKVASEKLDVEKLSGSDYRLLEEAEGASIWQRKLKDDYLWLQELDGSTAFYRAIRPNERPDFEPFVLRTEQHHSKVMQWAKAEVDAAPDEVFIIELSNLLPPYRFVTPGIDRADMLGTSKSVGYMAWKYGWGSYRHMDLRKYVIVNQGLAAEDNSFAQMSTDKIRKLEVSSDLIMDLWLRPRYSLFKNQTKELKKPYVSRIVHRYNKLGGALRTDLEVTRLEIE